MKTRPKAMELETERLVLRPLALEDAAQVQPLFARWEIVQLLAAVVPWPYPVDGVYRYYCEVALPAMERGEEWHWTLRLKTAPEEIIGSIGLVGCGETNRGFWLGLPWQGQGLMTEAAVATSGFWFEVLGIEVLRTHKAVGNVGSRRVSEKTGMRLVGMEEKEFVSGRRMTEVWEITREEWRGFRKGTALKRGTRGEV